MGATTLGAAAASAQDLYLTSQAQVNATTLTSVAGSIYIAGGDIRDLSPLSSISSVGGSVRIDNTTLLTNLNGLHRIASIPGNLEILRNSALTDIGALSGLTSVGGHCLVNSNAVTNLNGLSGLAAVGGGMEIANNPGVANLDGLSGLTSVGSVAISSNSSLVNLDGLSRVTSASGVLVSFNPSLTRFCGIYPMLWNGGFALISNNAVNPTSAQILAAGRCGSFAHSAPSGCSFGRELTLTGSPSPGGTITATMTGHDGAPFLTWGIGQPVVVSAMCSSCQTIGGLSQWQFRSTMSTTVPSGTAFLGLPLKAQGLDLAGSAGETCVAITPALWAFTDIHVATIGV
ncbi:MAG: hypothetical protein NXI31_02885 [bacterium]|nr:hypothetical protein [bacterium]